MVATMIIHAWYSILSFLVGGIFVEIRQLGGSIDPAALISHIPVMLGIIVVTADYGRRWYRFVSSETISCEEGAIPKCLLLPVIVVVCMIVCYYFLLGGLHMWLVTILFILFGLLFSGINVFFCRSSKGGFLTVHKTSRRFVVIMPLIFVAISSILFGCCYAMAMDGQGLSIVLYSLPLFYFAWWVHARNGERKHVEAADLALLGTCTLAAIVFFYGYYNLPDTLVIQPNIALAAKVLALSIYCGGVVAIPGVFDLCQFEGFEKAPEYEDHSLTLSKLIGAATVAVYICWSWIDLSPIFLIVFAGGSSLWIGLTKFRNEPRPILLSAVSVAIMAVTLIVEFCGICDGLSLPIRELPFEKLFVGICAMDVAAVFKTVKDNSPMKLRQMFSSKGAGYRVVGWHFLGLFVSALWLFFVSFAMEDKMRTSFALVCVFAQTVADILIWLFSKPKEKEKE